jgi:hypothetical protein
MPLTGYFDPSVYGIEGQMRGQTMPGSTPSYDDILAANTAARTRTTTTPNGQTFTTSDPNYSLGQYVQDAVSAPTAQAFRDPKSVQDFATANGTPLSADALRDYTKRNNDYEVMSHPNLQGIGGWMHKHPVGTIAAFIAAAAGGSALSGYGFGGTGSGWGGGGLGGGLGGEGGGGLGGLGGSGGAGGAGSDLGIFSNGGVGGMAGVGGGNAGALAASGGIEGGAGTGIWGSLGGSGLLSQGSIGNAGQLNGLMGGGQSQGGGSQPMPYSMPNLSGMLGSQPQQQPATPSYMPLPTQTPYYMPTRGYTPHDFLGAKVWT